MTKIKNKVSNPVISEKGERFASINKLARHLDVWAGGICKSLEKNGYYERNGIKYFLESSLKTENAKYSDNVSANSGFTESMNSTLGVEVENSVLRIPVPITAKHEDEAEYQEFRKQKELVKTVEDVPFEIYDIKLTEHETGSKYAIALFSDAHIEETVTLGSVQGLNEYNIDIAEERIKNYFNNLANCINKDEVDDLIFASLGDTISGYIHEELAQCNGMAPSDAILKAQSLIFSGLKFLLDNTNLQSIKFVGIVGNHSRTTKKIQHANGYKMSFEWLMYQNIKRECELVGLPVEFYIPESEMAIIDTAEDHKRFIFIHGFQIKSNGSGTVCGIYPALNRLSMKWDKTFHQDKIYLGHFHSCVSIPNATVNGSIIGYNAFAMTNGFVYEKPAQQYEVYDTKRGLLLTRQIYCD